jgi:hypothetical protein
MDIVTYFDFVIIEEKRLKISDRGQEFVEAAANERIAILRNKLLAETLYKNTMALLNQSVTGRIRITVIADLFHGEYGSYVFLSDVAGFIDWAVACHLFDFDKRYNEIFRVSSHRPRPFTGIAS